MMDTEERKWIGRVLKKLDFVMWDRYWIQNTVFTVFGWIERKKDSYKDFVILDFTLRPNMKPSCIYFLGTSSAEYSEKIADILGSQHTVCNRMEYFMDGNVVKEKKENQKGI